MLDNYPDVLSFRQVMEITHVGRNLLLRLLNSGEIPAFKMGKLWKVYKQDLIQYMSQCHFHPLANAAAITSIIKTQLHHKLLQA